MPDEAAGSSTGPPDKTPADWAKPSPVASTTSAAPRAESDDEDDLDDVLDEFTPSAAPPQIATATGLPQGAKTATETSALGPDGVSTAELEEQMRALLGGGEGSGDKEDGAEDDEVMDEMRNLMQSPEFTKQLNEFMTALTPGLAGGVPGGGDPAREVKATGGKTADLTKDQGGGAASTASTEGKPAQAATSSAGGEGGAAGRTPSGFQDTLRRTMERLQDSDEMASAAATGSEALGMDEDSVKRLLEEMQAGGMSLGNEEEMEDMLKSLLGEMTDKEVLYEPMKELADKYPPWLEANRTKLSADEVEGYEEQSRRVKEIVAKFEEPGYRDGDEECRTFIMERMEQDTWNFSAGQEEPQWLSIMMQEAGNHPEDLVGAMDATQQALDATSRLGKGLNSQMGCPQV